MITKTPKITITRVRAGDQASKPVDWSCFTCGEVPADGFVIYKNGLAPVYVRDTDIDTAKAMAKIHPEEPAEIVARSWGE